MKTSQRTLLTLAIAAALCVLLVAAVNAAPADPNVLSISKTVSPQTIRTDYTGVLTYTVTLTNHYTETIEDVEIWDVLHPALSFGEWVGDTPDNFVAAGNILSWTVSISVNTSVDFVFTAELPEPATLQGLMQAEGKIDNTVYFSYPFEDTVIVGIPATATTRFYRYIFLPLVMRSFTP